MNKLSIEPVGHKILVEPKPLEEVTESGIYLQYENKRLVQVSEEVGKLVAVGGTAWNAHLVYEDTPNGRQGRPGKPWAKVGDYVSYSKFAGSFITDHNNGKDYVLMNDDDIGAVLHDHEGWE